MSKKFGEKFEEAHVYEERMRTYREEHTAWRLSMRQSRVGFFPIFSNDFKDVLCDLSGNALKLYLYLGFHADTKTGETTLRIETIANYFGAKKRTVQAWMQELTDRGLVDRIQVGYRRKAMTFIRPYPGAKYNRPDPDDDTYGI